MSQPIIHVCVQNYRIDVRTLHEFSMGISFTQTTQRDATSPNVNLYDIYTVLCTDKTELNSQFTPMASVNYSTIIIPLPKIKSSKPHVRLSLQRTFTKHDISQLRRTRVRKQYCPIEQSLKMERRRKKKKGKTTTKNHQLETVFRTEAQQFVR